VDAREQLRRYLEQRRELGESELVLDALSVDDVLRVLGAKGAARAAPRALADAPPPVEARADPPAQAPRAPESFPAGERSSPEDAPADWRETLRAAGGAPDQQSARGGAQGENAMARERRTASPKVTGDPAKDAATARRGTTRGRSDEGMDDSPAPGAATKEGGGRRRRIPSYDLTGFNAPVGLTVGAVAGELFGGPFQELTSLDDIAETVAKCRRCPLYATAINPVPGEGNPKADLVCVGEAPGANEDQTGRPFVGQAGQLLTKILAAIKLAREDVFIANVLKHRPPENRNPKPDEVEACSPYLVRQLELIRPKVILAFGTFAAQTLLDTKTPIGKLRGAVHRYYGVPLIVTYHPAALLRNPAWKRPTWEDVQLARRILDRLSAA
jgi:uracil-DNA glycosylase